MKLINTTGRNGEIIYMNASHIVAFRHKKAGGIDTRPQTTVWVGVGMATEEWVIFDAYEDFKCRFLECVKRSVRNESKSTTEFIHG